MQFGRDNNEGDVVTTVSLPRPCEHIVNVVRIIVSIYRDVYRIVKWCIIFTRLSLTHYNVPKVSQQGVYISSPRAPQIQVFFSRLGWRANGLMPYGITLCLPRVPSRNNIMQVVWNSMRICVVSSINVLFLCSVASELSNYDSCQSVIFCVQIQVTYNIC